MAEIDSERMMDGSTHPESEEPPMEELDEHHPTPPASAPPKKRPRLDLTTEPRKRGKTMFGILVGTLNKAKTEDLQRNRSEAARRRMNIETKLQSKLAHEQTEIRRQDEIKKNRSLATRKEDELAIQESVFRLSHRTKPYLSHFLTTSDTIPLPSSDSTTVSLPMSVAPPVAKQTVLYYLPAILLPEQEAFLKQRQEAITVQVESEQRSWKEEKRDGLTEVESLRQHAEELDANVVAMESGEVDISHPTVGEDETAPAFAEVSAESTSGPSKVEDEGDAGDEALEY